MEEKNIPKVGEWWVIEEKPKLFSSALGVDGRDQVCYPYIFQVKKIKKSTNFDGYNIGDHNNYGWAIMTDNIKCFRKAELSDLTCTHLSEEQMLKIAKQYFVKGTQFYCAHDSDGKMYGKQLISKEPHFKWNYSNFEFEVVVEVTSDCCIYDKKNGWSKILNTPQKDYPENEYFYTIPITDEEVKRLTPVMHKLAEKGNFKDYMNTWSVRKNACYVNTSNSGWGYFETNIKNWKHYSKSTQLSVDEFITKFSDKPSNEIFLEGSSIKFKGYSCRPGLEIPLPKSTETNNDQPKLEYDFSIPKKSTISIQSIPINLTIPTFNF
jgi:hypothetical protein